MVFAQRKKRNKAREAFTLMEVMLAVAIIGILAAVAGPAIMRKWREVNINTTKSTMQSIKAALMDYRQDMGHFPTKREGSLDALVQKPTVKGNERWDGPYLEGKSEMPTDAWNNDFIYNTGTEITQKDRFKYFEIISYGANGEPGGEGKENQDLYAGS